MMLSGKTCRMSQNNILRNEIEIVRKLVLVYNSVELLNII